MKNNAVALALLAALCATPSQALPENVPPPLAFSVITDTVTILYVDVSTWQPTSVGTLSGGHYVIVQSTDGTSGFGCSFDVSASSLGVAGRNAVLRAKKEPGGNFYELELKRWARDLVLKCTTFATTNKLLTIFQGR